MSWTTKFLKNLVVHSCLYTYTCPLHLILTIFKWNTVNLNDKKNIITGIRYFNISAHDIPVYTVAISIKISGKVWSSFLHWWLLANNKSEIYAGNLCYMLIMWIKSIAKIVNSSLDYWHLDFLEEKQSILINKNNHVIPIIEIISIGNQ